VSSPGDHRARPLIITNAIGVGQAQLLRDHLDRTYQDPGAPETLDGRCDYGPIDGTALPAGYLDDDLTRLLGIASDHFGLPAPPVSPAILRYNAGAHHPGHRDRNPTEPHSLARTISLSILLSAPGDSFTGGVFEVFPGRPVYASIGDAIAITADTPHRVTRVTSGERYVVVAFGATSGPCDHPDAKNPRPEPGVLAG
jgi:hypothetical protein